MIPYNCFRILLEAQALLFPDFQFRIYAPTAGDDTHVIVVKTCDFWSRFDREASLARRKLFEPLDFLDEAWGLSKPARPASQWQATCRAHLRNFLLTITVALVVASALSVVVLLISLLTNTWYFERFNSSTWKIIGTYFAGFCLAAIPVGVLLPFAKYWLVTLLLGAIGGTVIYGAVAYSIEGQLNYLLAPCLGVIVGAPVAYLVRRGLNDQ